MSQYAGILPYDRKLLATRPADDGRREWYLLDSHPVIRGTDLRDARVSSGGADQPLTTFTLSPDAARRFEQYTRASIGKRSAIVLDQQILSAPVIEDVIRDSGQIRGVRDLAEAQDLAINLRSGALPAAIEVIQERTVEASLGADSIRQGMRAGAAGLAIAGGFSKAFATLVDTHVTTVVSCAFLFFFGTPAVKGFAATLVIGLITNLFTSVFVSRVAFDWQLSRGGTSVGGRPV